MSSARALTADVLSMGRLCSHAYAVAAVSVLIFRCLIIDSSSDAKTASAMDLVMTGNISCPLER